MFSLLLNVMAWALISRMLTFLSILLVLLRLLMRIPQVLLIVLLKQELCWRGMFIGLLLLLFLITTICLLLLLIFKVRSLLMAQCIRLTLCFWFSFSLLFLLALLLYLSKLLCLRELFAVVLDPAVFEVNFPLLIMPYRKIFETPAPT